MADELSAREFSALMRASLAVESANRRHWDHALRAINEKLDREIMTLDGWKAVVLNAFDEHERGDDTALNLVAKLLAEQDAARQVLRDKGYGWTGLPIVELAGQVPHADAADPRFDTGGDR